MKNTMHFSKVIAVIVSIFLTGYIIENSRYIYSVIESLELITELFTIFVSFSIFGITWYSHNESRDNNALFLGTIFFIIGLFDLFHTLSYPFMPDFVTPNSSDKSAFFWIAARSISAPLFLLSAYIYKDTLYKYINKTVLLISLFLLTSFSFISLLYLDIFFNFLNSLIYTDEGLFAIRVLLVPVTVSIILVTSYLYILRIKETGQNNYFYLIFGFIAIIVSDTVYFSFETSAHLIKIVSFYFIFVALYRSSIILPYERLAIAEEKLRFAAEERYINLFNNANDAIVTTGPDDRITSWNKSAEKIFYWEKNEAIGKDIKDLIVLPELHSERNVIIGYVIAGGEVNGFDTVMKRKDGELINVSVTISPLRDGNERIIGISAIIRDITERKRVENELTQYRDHLEELVKERTFELTEANDHLQKEIIERKRVEDSLKIAKEEAEKANNAKSNFLSTMSHELRTPLNSIIGFSDLLKEKTYGDLNEKQENYITNILTSSKSLINIIDDILDLSKIEAGKTELVIEKMPVHAAMNETINLIKEKALKHNVLLKLEIDPQLDYIKIDRQKFRQILLNLVSNAVKFSKEKSGTVTIMAKKEGEQAIISVSDNGIGIRKEDMDKVFDKFQQIDSGLSRKYGGTGLGLSISKQLLELLGGRITIDSEYGEGSTFTIFLPLNGRVEK